MQSNKENVHKSKYRIKLLADNNVIMVEADNYETEIFIPQIVEGRITFQNVIPNRRCCKITAASKTNAMEFVRKDAKNQTKNEQNMGRQAKICRNSEKQDAILMPAPLANSTPTNSKQSLHCGQSYNKNIFGLNSQGFSCDSILPSPEPVRRAVTVKPHKLEKSMLRLSQGIKVARIYPSPSEGTPKKVGRLVGSSLNINRLMQSPNSSRLNGSFSLMTSPIVSRNTSKSSSNIVVDSMARWRKVLTPVRTYTRITKQPVMLPSPVKVASAKKFYKPCRITPTYLVNPTKGPNVTQCIEIKKCKLAIDRKLCISPKTFKRQQQEKYDNCLPSVKPLPLPKSRQLRDIWGMSAFDLLTNSNRNRCLSSKLNAQFRNGCINKASSTYIKYKILSRIPPLEQDEQVLELSRISMQADRLPN